MSYNGITVICEQPTGNEIILNITSPSRRSCSIIWRLLQRSTTSFLFYLRVGAVIGLIIFQQCDYQHHFHPSPSWQRSLPHGAFRSDIKLKDHVYRLHPSNFQPQRLYATEAGTPSSLSTATRWNSWSAAPATKWSSCPTPWWARLFGWATCVNLWRMRYCPSCFSKWAVWSLFRRVWRGNQIWRV